MMRIKGDGAMCMVPRGHLLNGTNGAVSRCQELISPGSVSRPGALPPGKCLDFRFPTPLQETKPSAPTPTLEKHLIYSFAPSKSSMECFLRRNKAGTGQHLIPRNDFLVVGPQVQGGL